MKLSEKNQMKKNFWLWRKFWWRNSRKIQTGKNSDKENSNEEILEKFRWEKILIKKILMKKILLKKLNQYQTKVMPKTMSVYEKILYSTQKATIGPF